MGIWSVKVIEGSILSGRARTGSATTLKDDAKNMETDAFKEKFIKINLNGIEYVLANPVSFSGGLDEVKPVDRTEYFVI